MSFSTDQIDHINIKIFTSKGDATLNLEPAIPMYHRWIQESLLDELLIDIADYHHVPDGPGVMLIGHQNNYSLDLAFGRLGLLYNSKLPTEGTLSEKLQSAYAHALAAATLVEDDPAFRGQLEFNAGELEVIFNDRLLAPNTSETWNAVKPVLQDFFTTTFGQDAFSLEHVGEPRERLRVAVHASKPLPVSSLLDRTAATLSK